MNYRGVIIEESLIDTSVLKQVRILSTKVEKVIERHKTPWLKRWTLHTVEISEGEAENFADVLSRAMDPRHGGAWYADFKNDKTHYIIFLNKVFRVDRRGPEGYAPVKEYGLRLGIPKYQLNFSPEATV